MSAKAIREADGKRMLATWLQQTTGQSVDWDLLQVTPSLVLGNVCKDGKNEWLLTNKLVVKPDQLIKRRGKSGLIKLNSTWEDAQQWISERNGKEVKIEAVSGVLDHFLVERFWPHAASDEYYVCIQATRAGDEILFYHEGGVDVGDVDSKATRLLILVGDELTAASINEKLLTKVPDARRPALSTFLALLYKFFVQLHYTYLEINPIIMIGDSLVVPLDMAAKIDETAKFECGALWGGIEFPPPFGRPLLPEEARIAEMDSKTGASLKLTVLNPKGRVWTMVAGGGASVIYADTISDLGASEELANYGEYSGAPDEEMTFQYARTILELMTKERDSRGKVLIIGGGIANFTNVAETFKGIIRALTKFSAIIIEHHIRIYVRRGGPNYQEGLDLMRNLARSLELDIEVYGPETHMTAIVSMALGKELKVREAKMVPSSAGSSKTLLDHVKGQGPRASVKESSSASSSSSSGPSASPKTALTRIESSTSASSPAPAVDDAVTSSSPPSHPSYELFTPTSRALIYGLQPTAAQTMLDFDFICGRKTRSVAALVYPFTGNHYQKFYWATGEVLLPIFQDLGEAVTKNADVDVVINFASMRSVYESTIEIMKHSSIKTIAIIAEGVPERQTRLLLRMAKAKGVTIIGPATVGGIKAGCFRIGNTGGALDNIIAARLYRAGSVAYVARSGGMSNELNNIIAQNSDGVYEGIAIGGDRYPGTTFIDHLLRYQDNPAVKLMVVLGEVGGVEEYEICKLIKSGRLTKPTVAWCIGTCAKMFPYEVQFGHAGACASGAVETADAKNAALKAHGVHVPTSFDDFGRVINEVYVTLVESGEIIVKDEQPAPTVPVDYDWARKLGLIRKPAGFVSSIVDERGDELEYAGMKISEVLRSSMGIGGVVGLIWFRKRLPDYFCRFIELVLMVTADHGPAVAGAHNTIVAARAGKDLISSLCSGLLTIGPRFGGALDGAAQKFSWGYDTHLSGEEFVNTMRRNKELIMGIGHRIKSLENPDARVVIVKEFAKKYFRSTEVLDYACSVELITSRKKSNLILNVDGAIGCAFVDLLRSCGAFTLEEANEYVEIGALNGLFVLGRSIGFIGHYIDQNRLKQPLYRHPQEDISYLTKDAL